MAPSAAVKIADGSGSFQNQGQGYIQELFPGDGVTFALQSESGIAPGQSWVLQFLSPDTPSLNGLTYRWSPSLPSGDQPSFTLPSGGFLARYVSSIVDSQNVLSQFVGLIFGLGNGGLITRLSAAGFTQPSVSSNVTAVMGTTAPLASGAILYIPVGGYYQVASVTDGVTAVLTNLGAVGNASPGASIPGKSEVMIAGPQGTPGSAGPAGTGTSIAAATSIAASGTVPSFGSGVNLIREDIDMSVASQITRTLSTPSAGCVYWIVLLNLGTTANVQPVLIAPSGGAPIQDPAQTGTKFGGFSSTAVACTQPGVYAWQRNAATGWVCITNPQNPGMAV